MPYNIPGSIKILIYFGNNTSFVYLSWHSVSMPGMYILLCPLGRKGTLLPTHSVEQSSERFKPLSVTILLWQVIVELENNTNNRKKLTVYGAWNLTK